MSFVGGPLQIQLGKVAKVEGIKRLATVIPIRFQAILSVNFVAIYIKFLCKITTVMEVLK